MANVFGTVDKDVLFGGVDSDILKGEAGNDLLDGKGGADLMIGDAGDDIYIVDSGGDAVFENAGAGHDTVRSSVSHVLANNIEDLVLIGTSGVEGFGNSLDNIITGNVANNMLAGSFGNDTIDGGAGDDTLLGGEDEDTIDGGIGDDMLFGDSGDDTLDGGVGNDTLEGNAGHDRLIGGEGQDVATYRGSLAGYSMGLVDGRLSIVDIDTLRGGNLGSDTLEAIEQLAFDGERIQIGPVHTEFRVNTFAAGNLLGGLFESTSAVTALGDGGFVVVWSSEDPDDNTNDVYAQRYDAAGRAAGAEFRVNSFTSSDQDTPTITALANGGFVVTWESFAQDSDSNGVYAQRYTAGGSAVGAEFQVNSFVSEEQTAPTIAALADGGFVVTWRSSDQQGDSFGGVYAQRYGADGLVQGAEFRVNSLTAGEQGNPDVAALADGGFVVTWNSVDQGLSNFDIYAQRYDVGGVAVGTEFQVNGFTTGGQYSPMIAALTDGGFVVTWVSANQDSSGEGIYAQRYDADGVAAGAEFQVNSFTTGAQHSPTIAALTDGGFVVAWSSFGQDGVGSQGIYAQRYDATGIAVGAEFLVNSTTADNQTKPTIAALPDGGFVLTWTSFNPLGENSDIYAQRYNADGTVASLEADGGNNTLSFSGGSARLAGGLGDDVYVIDDSGDQVIEGFGAGTDTVRSSANSILSNNVEHLILTGAGNNINGTGNNLINTITGTSGDNVLDGGLAGDRLVGGGGNDTYVVDGDDVVDERVDGGTDTVVSRATYILGNDVENLQLVSVADISGIGNALNNAITGSYGNNFLDGGWADDTLDGSFGDDTLVGGTGNDHLIGGEGQDAALYNLFADSAGYRFVLVDGKLTVVDIDISGLNEGSDTLEGVERIIMGTSTFNVTLSGAVDDPEVLIEGNSSANTLSLIGGSGQLAGGGGDDTYFVDDVGDVVIEAVNAGTDAVKSFVDFTLSDNAEHLTLLGTSLNGNGNGLDNTITGNGNDNTLDGGLGNDRMVGGGGNDTYIVNSSLDIVVESAGGGTDKVISGVSYTLSDNVENLQLFNGISGVGNALANVITGNVIANTLNGVAGNDVLDGDAGDDTLIGGLGNDELIGGAGQDVASYSGPMAGYRIGQLADGRFTVVDFDARNGNDGTDTLEGIERLSFGGVQVQIGEINTADTEFQVNTFATGSQGDPSITGLANGGFVVTWLSESQDGNFDGVFAQRYNASGTAVGAEFQVNSFTFDNQNTPAVAALADGGFIVTWASDTQDGEFTGIYAQRYNAAGATAGAEFKVNTTTAGGQFAPTIAALENGGFVVTWSSSPQDGDGHGVYAQRYDATGAVLGAEFRVNSFTTNHQAESKIVALADGGFVVTWNSFTQDGSAMGVYAQRYDAAGAAAGPEFRVNSFTTGAQIGPGIAALADGGFVVAWNSSGQAVPGTSDIFAQRYDAAGAPVGAEFAVTIGTVDQFKPAIAALADGGFVMTWNIHSQSGGNDGIFAQRYDAAGNTVGAEFQINSSAPADQAEHAITALADGGFVVTWHAEDQNGIHDVYARRYDADGEPVSSGAGGGGGSVVIEGGNGNDTLSFIGGSAQLEGGLGNDTYFVDDIGDLVIEALSAGTDTVQSSITYTLTDNVEHLTLTGSRNNNGTGNALNNTITGSFSNNILNGGLGNDRLVGGDGNDYYIVNGGDTVVETAFHGSDTVEASVNFVLGAEFENLRLTGSAANGTGNAVNNRITGNALANTLNGSVGNDTLTGGLGNDTLIGGAGNDSFVFSSALGGNIDRILDFNAVADSFILDNDVFSSSLQAGTLNQFLFFAGTAAHDINDRIIYNSATGKLFYDADGNGAGAQIQFATVNPGTALSHVDFLIVA